MTTQSEYTLENNLVAQLQKLGYKKVSIKDKKDLLANFKSQLEIHNKRELSKNDFTQICNHINKGNIFERAKILRGRVQYKNDQGDNKTIELINQIEWCKNQFQVAQQITMEGSYTNRYDVTILINGLPLVQIELKRRGLELKEAFNQINRYQKHSYKASNLFLFIQIFVISNGVNTKYYANSPRKARSFKQTFFWTDVNNKLITQLTEFSDVFLEPCHISKMITKYIVIHESDKILMVLRPYQFYAVEAIVERTKNSTENGYIWHTTGSGKTLTSFKAAQILTNLPVVYKVVFVVDRRDLDYQTIKEFNSFSKGSIDGTTNTKTLVKQMVGDNALIVTTIQKLNFAISKTRYLSEMETLKEKRIVFIFDECHRSQFGETHTNIKRFFTHCQMFGFTGTPIFEENASVNKYEKRTTSMLFDKILHKYVIIDAIRDGNVLKFSIEYIQTVKKKEGVEDENVEEIDKKEVMDALERLEKITDYIITHHKRKTHNKKFTSIFAISNITNLIKYYKLFHQKKEEREHDFSVATIFSYQANEPDIGAGSFDEEESLTDTKSKYQRECLEEIIVHYNTQYHTNYTTKDSKIFYDYYNDIAKRVKNKEIDILLVVNMFLTGFDSKFLNTLYVDKNLKHHGLIQAYSRTNRILDEVKSHGNIVCFRDLKDATDDAISLFSNPNAKEEIILQPYDEYVEKFNQAYKELVKTAPTADSVKDLPNEDEELKFVKSFRELMHCENVLKTFTDFDFADLLMEEQSFEDYKSKYLDLYEKTKSPHQQKKTSILNDVDFKVELTQRYEIDVNYILGLLAKIHNLPIEKQGKERKSIIDTMRGDIQMRKKLVLIEQFIQEELPKIKDSDDIPDELEKYREKKKIVALEQLTREENLDAGKLRKIIENYIYTEKKPLRDEVIAMMKKKPSLKERKTVAERIVGKILRFVEVFIE